MKLTPRKLGFTSGARVPPCAIRRAYISKSYPPHFPVPPELIHMSSGGEMRGL
jgi:hypothetical protein